MKTIIYDIVENEFKKEFCIYDYEQYIVNKIFFETLEFHEYHEKNCEQLYRVINVKKGKIIGVYYIGIRGNQAFMPYSSPFSQINILQKLSYNDFNNLINGMKKICKENDIKEINVSLPPLIYNREIETQFLVMINNGFKIDYINVNHYFDLMDFENQESFVSKLPHAQRKNYKRVIKEDLKFYKVENNKFEDAFEVIEINRQEKGYPLRMSREQVRDILQFNSSANIEFFVIENREGNKIASAMVYKVNDNVCQVIYWGHIDKYSSQRPMSLLSVKLCEYYKNKGMRYLDIGPSSENGNWNINLAQFKVDMGCMDTSKFTLKLKL